MNKIINILLFTVFSVIGVAEAGPLNVNSSGVFIDGYDVVAYFTDDDAQRGSSEYQTQWQEATLFFASEQHLNLFLANPEAYLPQFAGHCANGLSDGHLVRANPEIYRVIDGKLYLFFSWWGKAQWKYDQQEQIKLASEYWEKFNN